jgi:hypothetical protein
MGDWASAFSNFGSKLFNGNNIGNFGNLVGGVGTMFGASGANKLGNAQIDLTKQQNQLLLSKYEDDKRRRDEQDKSFASVWG